MNIATERRMTTTAEGVETEQQRRIAARARLFGNAGLSVQPAKAGGRYQATAVCAPTDPDPQAKPDRQAQAGGAQGVVVLNDGYLPPSLRAKRSNPSSLHEERMDCFACARNDVEGFEFQTAKLRDSRGTMRPSHAVIVSP